MLLPSASYARSTSPSRGSRRGAILNALLLVMLPVLLVIMFMAINAASLAEARQQLQNCADAAALAGAQTLVDDRWLTGQYTNQLSITQAARVQAQTYATVNPVLTLPLTLKPVSSATANPPHGDLVFANLITPLSKTLTVCDLDHQDSGGQYDFLPSVNTVRIAARRNGDVNPPLPLFGRSFTTFGSIPAKMHATATLDRDVIGFNPIKVQQPLPLVPIALMTDASGQPVGSWQVQTPTDQWNYDRTQSPPVFVYGQSDGLPEYVNTVRADDNASACLLLFGISDLESGTNQAAFQRQVTTGVLASDLQSLGGQLLLANASNTLTVPAAAGNSDSATLYANIQSWLNQIQGQALVWPLYTVFDPGTGQATLNGFVAARLATASASVDGNGVQQLTLTLQPCMLSTRTAVTNAAQRGVGGVTITNPYVCRVRLVE